MNEWHFMGKSIQKHPSYIFSGRSRQSWQWVSGSWVKWVNKSGWSRGSRVSIRDPL